MTDARARIHAMFPLDEAATAELDLRLDALIVEALIKAGVQYVDCPVCGAARPVGGECGTCAFKARMAAELAARGMTAQSGEKPAAGATAAPALTVYRASHDSIVMGLYATAAEARKHCEAEERHSWSSTETPTFDWIEDEEDGVAELTAWVGGEECVTGYEVTALEISATYDEEADA